MFLWQKFHANFALLRERERGRERETDDAIAKSRCMMMPCPEQRGDDEQASAFHAAGENRSNVKYPPDGAPSSTPDNGGPIIGFLWALET